MDQTSVAAPPTTKIRVSNSAWGKSVRTELTVIVRPLADSALNAASMPCASMQSACAREHIHVAAMVDAPRGVHAAWSGQPHLPPRVTHASKHDAGGEAAGAGSAVAQHEPLACVFVIQRFNECAFHQRVRRAEVTLHTRIHTTCPMLGRKCTRPPPPSSCDVHDRERPD